MKLHPAAFLLLSMLTLAAWAVWGPLTLPAPSVRPASPLTAPGYLLLEYSTDATNWQCHGYPFTREEWRFEPHCFFRAWFVTPSGERVSPWPVVVRNVSYETFEASR